MATNISGLFGIPTPEQERASYLDSMLVSPGQMGSQSLLQQVVSQMSNAGANIGALGGRMFGGKLPGEIRQARINEAIKSAGPEGQPWEKLSRLADILDQDGMTEEAAKARAESNRLKTENLSQQKTQQELQPEYKDFKIEVKKPMYNKDTGEIMGYYSDNITVTRRWNPKTKQYEDINGGAPKGDGEASKADTGPATPSQADQAKAILEKRRQAAGGSYAPPPEGGSVTPVPGQPYTPEVTSMPRNPQELQRELMRAQQAGDSKRYLALIKFGEQMNRSKWGTIKQ